MSNVQTPCRSPGSRHSTLVRLSPNRRQRPFSSARCSSPDSFPEQILPLSGYALVNMNTTAITVNMTTMTSKERVLLRPVSEWIARLAVFGAVNANVYAFPTAAFEQP